MRATAVVLAGAIYAGARAAAQLASGVAAADGSPLADTATQGGIVVVCIGLVYWFLQRGDRLASTQRDVAVADLQKQLAVEQARNAGLLKQVEVADTESRAWRLEGINARDKLIEVQVQLIATQRELAETRVQLAALIERK